MLVRYPNGVDGEFFYQKRAPQGRPDWIDVVELRFPSGRAAQEVVPRDAASLARLATLACLELHPHPVRADDLEHPDELRVDLDPVLGFGWNRVRDVAGIRLATASATHPGPRTTRNGATSRPACSLLGAGVRAARRGRQREARAANTRASASTRSGASSVTSALR